MRNICTILLVTISYAAIYAQGPELTLADKKEIRTEARKIIENQLPDLLNMISQDNVTEIQREVLIYDSYLTSRNRIFYDDKVVIEDDVNPENTVNKSGPDLMVRPYLENLKLYYNKSNAYSIKVSEVSVGEVLQKEYPYVQVRFRIQFGNTHRQKTTKYQSVYRVAELRADRPDKQWLLLISGIRYYTPTAPAEQNTSVVTANPQPATPGATVPKTIEPAQAVKKDSIPVRTSSTQNQPISVNTQPQAPAIKKTQEPVSVLIDNIPQDKAVTQSKSETKVEKPMVQQVEKPEETVASAPVKKLAPVNQELVGLQKNLAKNRRQTSLLRVGALASVGIAAVNYLIISKSFTEYKNEISSRNAALSRWWNDQNAAGNSNGDNFGQLGDYYTRSVSFASFAKPGIYVSAAAIAVGGTLWLLSSKSKKEVRRYKKLIEQKTKHVSINPQWNKSARYAGLQISYQF